MDRHLLVLSLEAVVDKVEEVEVEEVREEVPSLDHTSGARANDLAELSCVFFLSAGYLFLTALSLTVNVRHAVLPQENS